jgi:hypothetical protein
MMSDDSGPMTERDILIKCRNEIVQQAQETRNKNLSSTQQSLQISLTVPRE